MTEELSDFRAGFCHIYSYQLNKIVIEGLYCENYISIFRFPICMTEEQSDFGRLYSYQLNKIVIEGLYCEYYIFIFRFRIYHFLLYSLSTTLTIGISKLIYCHQFGMLVFVYICSSQSCQHGIKFLYGVCVTTISVPHAIHKNA
jgi:hypothetical protein